jgi:hypothetical protein
MAFEDIIFISSSEAKVRPSMDPSHDASMSITDSAPGMLLGQNGVSGSKDELCPRSSHKSFVSLTVTAIYYTEIRYDEYFHVLLEHSLEQVLSENGINVVELVMDPDLTSHFFSNLYSEGKP